MKDQPDASVTAIFSSVRSLLIVLGTMLAGKGMTDTGLYFWVETIAGSIMVVGPAAWGVYNAITTFIENRKKVTQAVQAGVNLAVTGNALMRNTGNGMATPVPVTTASAKAIIKEFSDPVVVKQ